MRFSYGSDLHAKCLPGGSSSNNTRRVFRVHFVAPAQHIIHGMIIILMLTMTFEKPTCGVPITNLQANLVLALRNRQKRMIPRRKMIQQRIDLKMMILASSVCLLAATMIQYCSARATFGVTLHHQQRQHLLPTTFQNKQQLLRPKSSIQSERLIQRLRGGADEDSDDDEEESDEDGDVAVAVDHDEDEDMDDDEKNVASKMSTQPLKIAVVTNFGNSVVDHQYELNSVRTRDVASLKKSLSRQIPGRPPILSLELVYEGRTLDDEMLVDELFDDEDEDEDEDEEEDGVSKTLILNVVPPVDPKFAIELTPKLLAHQEDDDNTLSTEELVDAYFLNQAAMARNAQLMADPNSPSSPVLRMELREIAEQLRDQLQSQTPDDVWTKSLEPIQTNQSTEERRGQRYRSGKGGARTSLKKSIQHNMNINWGETIRNCILFLFFGYFGGRNSLSRSLMLWCAPMCFVVQARPIKMWSKVLFYMMINPPSIVLSLLPAPQQAILDFDVDKSYAALYNPNGVDGEPVRKPSADNEEDEDDDDEEDEETDDEYDSEDEDEEEESDNSGLEEYDSDGEEES